MKIDLWEELLDPQMKMEGSLHLFVNVDSGKTNISPNVILCSIRYTYIDIKVYS